jgi:hypothetical protein
MFVKLIAIATVCGAVYGQESKPVIDNERVTVWDVTGTAGRTDLAGRDSGVVVLGVVVLWLTGAKARTASFQEDPGDGRRLVIALKDHAVAPIENKTGYPAAFPRPHVKKLLENDRVVAWSYRWNPGEPTPMHFHDKDVVVVYLEPTALISTTPDGAKTLNEYKAFDVRFNKGNRTHTEALAHGSGSAMMLELK